VKNSRKLDAVWVAVLLLYCLYAGLFIYRTSFVINGERYFSLFDDAMISMTYAKNFAHGHGLVWNAGGEKVEGYTNLLWTLYMALLHLLPVAKSKMSLLVQATSAVLLLVNLFFVRKIAAAISGGSRFVALGAVITTAFYLPINNWSLQGMEVGLLVLLVSISIWKALQSMESKTFSFWPYAFLSLATLVRLDMAVAFAVMLAFMAWAHPTARRKHLTVGLIFFGIASAAQTIFRVSYYGDFLPNTYYHKLTGFPLLWRITRGVYIISVFIWRMNLLLFLVPLGLLVVRRKKGEMLLASIFLGQLAYSIYVGGDAWESWGGSNRYVCIAMPCFFILFFAGLETIGGLIRAYIATCRPHTSLTLAEKNLRRTGIALIFVSLASFNAIYGPAALGEMLLFRRPLHVEDNQRMVERALAIAKITNDRATVAVVWDGAIPYFSERPAVSILGKNDRTIAHERMRTASGAKKIVAFYPGHLKWDYAYSIGQLKPDVVGQLWYEPESAGPYLQREYTQVKIGGFGIYLRNGSANILWDRVRSLAAG
jgi:hypothetical protein